MADFQAQVKAVLDQQSLSQVVSDIKTAIDRSQFNVRFNQVSVNQLINDIQRGFDSHQFNLRFNTGNMNNQWRQYFRGFNDVFNDQMTQLRSSTLSNNIQTWMNNNTRAAQQFGEQLRTMQSQLNNNTSAVSLRQLSAEFQNVQSQANATGLSVQQFGLNMKNAITMALGIGSVYQAFNTAFRVVKGGISDVIDLDTALVDLQKTTTATTSQLNNFYNASNDIAKSLGSTTKEVIQAAADWSRLGYSIQDAETMAKTSSIFASISPGMDIEKATDGLVSAMKAFKIEADDALDGIASKINKIGKRLPKHTVMYGV